MNGVDLSKQIAKNQDLFRDTIKKNNEAYEKRISDLNNRHEFVQEKQLESFVNDKNDIEKNYQNHFNSQNEKTSEAIHKNQEDYNQKIREQRENFAQETENRRKEFDDRLKDIKRSYSKSLESEKDRNQDVEESQKKIFNTSIAENRKDSSTKLKSYQDKMLGSGIDLKDQYNKERKQMIESHENQLKTTIKDSVQKREELKDRIAHDIKKTREVAQVDLDHTKRYAEDRMKSMEGKFQDRYSNMAHDYSQRNESVVKRQQEENLKHTKDNQEKLMNLQRSFNGELRDIELEKMRRDNGSGEFAQIMEDQKGFNERIRYEKELKSMKNKLSDAETNFNENSKKELDGYKETLKVQKKESAASTERKINDFNAKKISTIAKEREKNTKDLDNLLYQKTLQKDGYDKQLVSERSLATDKYKNLKENFAKSLKEIEEKNKKNLEDLTKINQNDKSEFIKKLHESKNEELYSLRKEFNKVVNTVKEDYEKKLDEKERDNDLIKLTMEKRIRSLVDENEKQLATEKMMVEEIRKADSKAMASLQDQRDFEYKKKLNYLNDNHQKKMTKLQISHDTQIKLVTNDYENKLKELRNTQLKILTDRDANQKIEMDRLKQAYDAEKYGLVSSYENQIAEVRKSYQNQIDQLKDFKKLS
jgi:hypothetical protein